MSLSDIARAVEDQFHRDSVPVLKRQGWRPRVIPYDGYGTSARRSSIRSRQGSTAGAAGAEPTGVPPQRPVGPPPAPPPGPPPWPGSWPAW